MAREVAGYPGVVWVGLGAAVVVTVILGLIISELAAVFVLGLLVAAVVVHRKGTTVRAEWGGGPAKPVAWMSVLGAFLAFAILTNVGAFGPMPTTGGPETGVSYDHFVTNERDQSVRYNLFMDGDEICGGELGTGFLSDTDSCSAQASDGTHRYALSVQYAEGGTDRGEWVRSTHEIGFYLTDFGLELRTA